MRVQHVHPFLSCQPSQSADRDGALADLTPANTQGETTVCRPCDPQCSHEASSHLMGLRQRQGHAQAFQVTQIQHAGQHPTCSSGRPESVHRAGWSVSSSCVAPHRLRAEMGTPEGDWVSAGVMRRPSSSALSSHRGEWPSRWKAASRPPRMRMVVSNRFTVVSCRAEPVSRPSAAGHLLGCHKSGCTGQGSLVLALLHRECSMGCRLLLLGPAALPVHT